MERLFQPLLFFLARCSRNELIRHIEFLQAENEMLRKRISKYRIRLDHDEKMLLIKLGRALGPSVYRLITIVAPCTYSRWIAKLGEKPVKNKMGRPQTAAAVRDLVLKIARETGWGYTRILGELRELGVWKISRQTVVNILKREGLEPGPKRGKGSWDELVKMHAETLWQCDFFSKRLMSRRGIRQAFALVFINVAMRRVWVSECTCQLSQGWVEKQGKAFLEFVQREQLPIGLVTRDNDANFRPEFDQVFESSGITLKRLSFRAPNLNAFVERFIQTIQVECLDHFLVFGEKHFDYLVREYVEHYHEERPHQGLGNQLISGQPPPNEDGEIRCRERLGGLLKHYYRAAA